MDAILSAHFALAELTRTGTGLRNVPSPGEVENLRTLCRVLLEPIRERFGPIGISSGFRGAKVNEAVGGARSSAHRFGLAADLHPLSPGVSVGDVWHWLAEHRGLPIDQAIWEKRHKRDRVSEWVHVGLAVSLDPNRVAVPRGQAWKEWT